MSIKPLIQRAAAAAFVLTAASGCAADSHAPDTAASPTTSGGGSGSDVAATTAGESSGGGSTMDVGDDAAPMPGCTTNIEDELARLRVPGVAAGIIKDGHLVCTSAAGMANIEERRPVARDTVFAWASVSKTITATAVMVLFDDGEIGLDDDVGDYLPFPTRNPNCPSQPITFRQLLTHTSSIVDNDKTYYALYTIGDSPIALGDFMRGYIEPGGEFYNAGKNFDNECPGEVSEYSNIATGLLGHLVEEIAGMPFDAFCRERIFSPLGMDQTSFHLANLDLANVAMPHDGRRPKKFKPHGHVGFPTYPDGLLRTSVPHLARFLAMMARGGEYDGHRILAEDTAVEMGRVQFPNLDDTQGLGWYYDGPLFGHDGSDPGTSSLMFLEPETGAGALLVANGDWYNDYDNAPQAYRLLEALLEEANNG